MRQVFLVADVSVLFMVDYLKNLCEKGILFNEVEVDNNAYTEGYLLQPIFELPTGTIIVSIRIWTDHIHIVYSPPDRYDYGNLYKDWQHNDLGIYTVKIPLCEV